MVLQATEICKMCGGWLSHGSDFNATITNIVIDSREVKPGSLFVAIKGENCDGRDYIEEAFARGASCVLVTADSNYRIACANVIFTYDAVDVALGKIAKNYRQRFHIPVVAITGSNGKTTVKEMLKAICSKYWGEEHVLATSGNLNNHLGVPLTLFKLEAKHRVAIIEMGMNHSGELDLLTKIAAPTMAVVNNVMLAHAGFFKNLQEIAKAKGEIYHGLKIDKGIKPIACINLCAAHHELWLKDLQENKEVQIVQFGHIDNDYYISEVTKNTCNLHLKEEAIVKLQLQVLGRHNQDNALTAAVLAHLLGCSLESIGDGLEEYGGFKGRLERKKAFNGATIIDDSYNANPDSVKAAILAIASLPKPHWLLLGDLGELGELSVGLHQEIGSFAKNNGIDKLLTLGELAAYAASLFGTEAVRFATKEEVVDYCKNNLPSAATFLIKGSNSMQLWQVAGKICGDNNK